MKRVINFHKAFLPATLASVVVLVAGLISLATMGLNLGVDFQAGINQSVRLAYPVADVSYEGPGSPVLSIGAGELSLVFSGPTSTPGP